MTQSLRKEASDDLHFLCSSNHQKNYSCPTAIPPGTHHSNLAVCFTNKLYIYMNFSDKGEVLEICFSKMIHK